MLQYAIKNRVKLRMEWKLYRNILFLYSGNIFKNHNFKMNSSVKFKIWILFVLK